MTSPPSTNALLSPTSINDSRPPDPFTQRQVIKTKKIKRQQGSSRFITAANKELEPLPPIKGERPFLLTAAAADAG